MGKSGHISDIDKLCASLGILPEAVKKPVLVLISGLPGTGKTYYAKKLSERLPIVTLESDVLRRILHPNPTHGEAESARLFTAIHFLCERLLKEGHFVIIDATNLTESHRQHFYDIADRTEAKLVIVRVEAPEPVVKERLDKRARQPDGKSDADWNVYLRMKKSVDKIKRKHYSVDTSLDYKNMLDEIVEEIKN
jgi:predicted kinase